MLRLIASSFAVLWLTVSISFLALRVLPGDALEAELLNGGASQARVDQVRNDLGLNDPLLAQYGRYLRGLLRGDMGYSLINARPVSVLIGERLPSTLKLTLMTMILSAFVGVGSGIVAAGQGGVARLMRALIALSLSVPVYWSGTLVIILFSARLRWLPAFGDGEISHLVLPVLVLTFSVMGSIARMTQSQMMDTRRALHVQVARSKGLPDYVITWRHVMRVGMLPVISVLSLQTGFLLSGAVITESIFLRPGVGTLLLSSTLNRDFPVVQGVVVLSACAYLVLNFCTDVVYRLIDPRVSF